MLGIKNTERIVLKPGLAVFRQLLTKILEIFDQGGAVGLAAFSIAQGIELQRHPVHDPQVAQDMGAQRNGFDIAKRIIDPQQFDSELMELALAALLRSLVAKHGALVIQLHRQWRGPKAGNKRPRHPRRAFRTKRYAPAFAVIKGIHLLGDDIGGLAQGAAKNVGGFENRRRYFAIAVQAGDGEGRIRDMTVTTVIFGEVIPGAAWRLQVGHQALTRYWAAADGVDGPAFPLRRL